MSSWREPAGRDRSVYRALQDECDRLRRAVEAVRDVHRPYPIYELCGHDESDAACVDPVQLDDGTWTCGPLVAVVCSACCIDSRGWQTDACAEEHAHGDGLPLCPTIADLTALRQRRAGAALADHAAPLPKTVIDRGAYTGSAHGRGCR